MNTGFKTKAIFIAIGVFGLMACSSVGQPTSVTRYDPVTMDSIAIDPQHPPFIQELFIPSHGVKLSGFLLGANGAGPHPTVVLLHGYPGNEKNLDLAQSMRRAGFNVLFFHYRGAWGSQGEYALGNLSEDVASVLQFLRSNNPVFRVDSDKLSIVGHSMGGFAALRSASLDENVVCVAGMAAANLGEYAARDEAQSQGFKAYTDQLFMLNGFSGDKALAEIAENSDAFDVSTYGPQFAGKSVLLIAGAEDKVVVPDVQQRIVAEYLKHPRMKLRAEVLPGDHSFSSTRILLQRTVIDWLQEDCQ